MGEACDVSASPKSKKLLWPESLISNCNFQCIVTKKLTLLGYYGY